MYVNDFNKTSLGTTRSTVHEGFLQEKNQYVEKSSEERSEDSKLKS